MGKSREEYNLEDFLSILLSNKGPTNIIYSEAGWRLSYLPYAPDTEDSETAIILGDGECFLILYGDHRDQLKEKTRDEAVSYWKSHPELHGATSDEMAE